MNRLLYILVSIFPYTLIWAQPNMPEAKYEFYHDSAGTLYAPQNIPVFFTISFDGDGKQQPQLLKANKEEGMFLSEGVNELCNTTSLSTAKGKKKIKTCYSIIGDGTPPITKVKFIDAPYFSNDSGIFYGQGLKINISANDNLAGIKQSYYSLNEATYKTFKTWQQQFNNSNYRLLLYSEDNVGNLEKFQPFDFIVDINAPSTTIDIEGNISESIIAARTTFKLSGSDNLSGIKNIYYKIDDGKAHIYSKPVIISGLTNDEHIFSWYSIDNVKNEEPLKQQKFFFDSIPPELNINISGKQFEKENMLFVASGTTVQLDAVDNKAGLKSISYRLNFDNEQEYTGTISLPNKKGLKRIRYYATDKVENKSKPITRKMYVDLEAPETFYKINKATFREGDTIVFTGNTQLSLQSTDMESGIENIYYKISKNDDNQEQTYKAPLDFTEDGIYSLKYYAIDNVQNREKEKQLWIRVDNSIASGSESFADVRHEKEWIKTSNQNLTGSNDHGFYLWISNSENDNQERFMLNIEDKDSDELMALVFKKHGHNGVKLRLANKNATIPIITDGIAPSTSITFNNANKTIQNNKTYYGPGLTVTLTPTDNLKTGNTGVEQTFFSINGAGFGEYKNDLDIFSMEQAYRLRYYSIDSVKNMEEINEKAFTVDNTAPFTYPEFEKAVFGNYMSAKSRVKLISSDNLSGVKTINYRFNELKEKKYAGLINSDFMNLPEGEHILYYYATDNVGNAEQLNEMQIFVDHTAPVVDMNIIGRNHKKGNTYFVAQSAKINLSVEEEMTEIKTFHQKFSGLEYKNYTKPVKVPSKHGSTYFTYQCSDQVDNMAKKSFVIFTDTIAPVTQISFQGPTFTDFDTRYISKNTKIIISGNDNGSGIKQKLYGFSTKSMKYYSKALQLQGNGLRTIFYYAYDHVGNREKPKKISFYLDNTPPKVDIVVSSKSVNPTIENKITPYTFIHIIAKDNIENEKVMYSINGGEWQVYRKPLTYFEQGDNFTLNVIAEDRVHNKTEKSAKFIVE
ncbi:Ig-like domain-containing protein [Bacteroidales bacterium]|nr:Ig-like domain-containing protein [Bacteroidales bacterium]